MQGKFGFGCMRLPMVDSEVDEKQFSEMIESYFKAGFNYFDTAHGYLDGKSETAIRNCLTRKYPRDSYILTNKLSNPYFKSEGGVRPLFEQQLKACGVDYFDYYLMHAMNHDTFEKFKRCRAFETVLELKKEGKIRHMGISFHDGPDVLDRILTEYPQIEIVQIQMNYLDYDDSSIRSRECYEVCVKHGKDVIVMEPVKGGKLIKFLPDEAKKRIEESGNSPASLAIRFAASRKNVVMVLSGMSTKEQMEENISFMKNFKPLTLEEEKTAQEVSALIRKKNLIQCTGCSYCTSGCPKHIAIPDMFACLNASEFFNDGSGYFYYNVVHTNNRGKASDCIKCGKCEEICPQHLEVRKLLETVAEKFEKPGSVH